jgi:hypothetical protein
MRQSAFNDKVKVKSFSDLNEAPRYEDGWGVEV